MSRQEPVRRIDQPEPGFFKLRLVAKGWKVPAHITLFEDVWQVIIDGDALPPSTDPIQAGVFRVWETATRIDQDEYNRLTELRDFAIAHDPYHPAARPTKPIVTAELRPIHPKDTTQ